MTESYRIIFDLETLIGAENQPIPGTCSIYNMLAVQANIVGHMIQDGKLPDRIPFVEVITDRPESEREKIKEWLRFNDLMEPRSLLMKEDAIGDDSIIAVFDSNPERVKMWREVGATCFQIEADKPLVVAP